MKNTNLRYSNTLTGHISHYVVLFSFYDKYYYISDKNYLNFELKKNMHITYSTLKEIYKF